MKVDGARWEALCADFEAALRRLLGPLEARPDLWHEGPAGKWTAGQIVDHVTTATERYAEWFGAARETLRAGGLPRRGPRWPHQALICAVLIGAGRFPAGAKSPEPFVPGILPKREETMARLARAVARHREIGDPLSPADRDRLWLARPLFGSLSLPETVRLHAVHAWHHAPQVARIAVSSA